MKIAVVSAFFPSGIGGIGSLWVFDEALRISQRGIDVYAVRAFDSERLSRGNLHISGFKIRPDPRPLLFGVKHISAFPLLSILGGLHRLYFLSLYGREVASVVEKNCVDLIHAHFAYPAGFAGLLGKCESKRPLVVTLHGYDILVEPSVGYGMRLNRGLDAILRKVLEGADAVIVASGAVYKEAVKAGCDPKKLMIVPNGVDTNRFDPKATGSLIRRKLGISNRPVVFTLRHHMPVYGIKYVIEAAPMVMRKRPDVVFVIGGGGPFRQVHEKLAHDLGVAKNFIFVGPISPNNVPSYYAASDIFVIPSLMEGFGIATVEAMASGKPVIGSDVGGIPDIIRDGVNGFLVRPRDPEALAEKILLLVEHPNLAKTMGRKGRQIAEEEFDIDERVDKIIQLYSQFS